MNRMREVRWKLFTPRKTKVTKVEGHFHDFRSHPDQRTVLFFFAVLVFLL